MSRFACFSKKDVDRVATVTFDNGPINLFTPNLIRELEDLLKELRSNTSCRVVIFRSANSRFFLGHGDLNLFLSPLATMPPKPTELSPLQRLFESLRTLPQATVAVIEGLAIGAGNEFVLSCDMAFAVKGKGEFSQFETAVSCVPGATGSQRIPRLVGRMRALELILGCQIIDADLADHYGLINRAVAAAEIEEVVGRLAERIATFEGESIALNKVAVQAADPSLHGGLLEETHTLNQLLVTGEPQRRMKRLMEMGAQTTEFELSHFQSALENL